MATKRIIAEIAIKPFIDHLGILPEIVLEKLAADTFTKINERTPVDTGRARASWQIAEGEPDLTVAEAAESVPNPGMPAVNFTGKEPVFITNSLVYIEPLENGHSGQAPNGMVKVSLLEVAAEIETILKGVAK